MYHNPCRVQLSTGPVTGCVSQNCVCSSCPPGALKQHKFSTTVVLWQLNCGFEQDWNGFTTPCASTSCAPLSASFPIVLSEGMAVDTVSTAEGKAALCTWSAVAINESNSSPESSMTGILILLPCYAAVVSVSVTSVVKLCEASPPRNGSYSFTPSRS